MKTAQMVVDVKDVVLRNPDIRFRKPVSLSIREGEQWAIVGPNGAGKTLLADLIQSRFAVMEGEIRYWHGSSPSEVVKSIAFKDIYSLADYRNSYYQQRWHSTEADDIPLVNDLLDTYADSPKLEKMLQLFDVAGLLPKRVIYLSSGELRKFLIIRALLNSPKILILDNPFIGLDVASRELLTDMLQKMTELNEVQVVLLLSNPDDIPAMITHVLPVYDMTCGDSYTRDSFLQDEEMTGLLFPCCEIKHRLPVANVTPADHEVTFRMERVSIRYGERTILRELEWEVRAGEKWALSGPNGSGKSTLLSLVYADNPQSYANNIILFDRKRGSGESIWDIKRRIGYVSPEMHLYYRENVPAVQIVSSGFFDSIGLYRRCNEEQQLIALQWMELFGIRALKDRLFLTLSSGEQRLVLLARAFVKNPDLLILDEPLHGLDICHKKRVAQLIGDFCDQPGKTLIYVTHYAHELPACVDKHYELEKQR